MTKIDKYIENQGGILSGALADYMVKTLKISPNAAKKRIERFESPIHKLKGLFVDRQSFIYHANNFQTEEYYSRLEHAFSIGAKRAYAVITAINYFHGLIPKDELPNYVFSPVTKISGHLSLVTLIDSLAKHRVIFDYDGDHYALHPFLSEKSEPNFQRLKAIIFSKNLLIQQFSQWSRNIGLAAFDSFKVNGIVAGFQFSLTAPSYLNGLVVYKEGKPYPGFLVADVLIGNSVTKKEIEFFIQKIGIIRASNSGIRLLPVLIVDGVDSGAFNSLKQHGVLVASIREIFGPEYIELLKNLINTITNAGAILKKNPESFINLMAQLTKLVDGKTNNLRGDLFELAVGFYYGRFCQSLDIGKRIRVEGYEKVWEVDVLASYEKEVRVVECKGYNSKIDDTYIEKYLSEKTPALKKWLDKFYTNKRYVFEIWSTGGFTTASLELLKKAKEKTRKYEIDYLGKNEIIAKAKELQSPKLLDLLKEYYFKDL